MLPDGCIDLVFSPAAGLRIAGTMTVPLTAAASSDVVLGLRFRPAMASCFLQTPARAFTDKLLPLEDVWGKRGRTLEEELRNAEP